MKTFFTKILIVTICSFSALFVSGQCTNSPNGQWPEGTFTPTCSGVPELISNLSWPGEYSRVSVTTGTMYTFSSNVATDYLTIANTDATTTFTFGVTPVTWTATLTGDIRFYTHLSAACDGTSGLRERLIQCGTAPPPPPPVTNDDCANAITLTPGATCVPTAGTTVGATQSIPAILCGGFTGTADDDVWYKFTATATSHTVTVAGGPTFDAVVDVRSGGCNGTNIACADATFSNQSEVVNLNGLTIGNMYLIRVYDWSAGTGDVFTICVTTSGGGGGGPENDFCADAISIDCGDTIDGTTVGSTADNAGTCTTTNTSPGVWYSFVGNGQIATASLCGSAYDTKLSVYTGSCGAFTCVAGNDDFCGTRSQVSFLATMGTTYYILVHGFGQATGAFTLAMTCAAPVPGDFCSSAIPIDCGDSATGTTVGSTADNAGTCGTTNTSPGVWYTFIGTGSSVTATTCNGATWDTKLSVFTGSCGTLTCVGGNDDACGLQSSVTFASTAGTTYYILVHGFGQTTGAFTLFVNTVCLPCPGPNPPLVSNLTANSATVTWNSVPGATGYEYTVGTGQTLCPSGPSTSTVLTSANLTGLLPGTDYTVCVRTSTCSGGTSPSGWSSLRFFTPGEVCATPGIPVATSIGSTSATFSWAGVQGATYFYSIGTGRTCPNGEEIPVTGTTVMVSGLTPGTIYTFCVRCEDGAIYRSRRITTGPAGVSNDLCINATNIACGQTVTGTTVGMTADVVPFCGTTLTTAPGVWYSFVGTGQSVTASLCGSAYDTKIGVFTGACGALVCVTGNDDFAGCGLQSQVTFATTLGTTYRILVTGFSTAIGNFTLAITCTPPAFAPTETTTENRSRSLNDVALYPNPAQDLINVRWGDAFTGKDVNIQVVNQLGQTVVSQRIYDVANEVETISLSNLSEGIYIMALHTDGQATIYKKFVVGVTRP